MVALLQTVNELQNFNEDVVLVDSAYELISCCLGPLQLQVIHYQNTRNTSRNTS